MSMSFEEMEDKAIDGKLDYNNFPAYEYQYFSRLAKLGYQNRKGILSGEECVKLQNKYRSEYQKNKTVNTFFAASVKQQTELQKLIEPRAKLKEKSKEELLELIVRFESILNGTLETADGELCNFSKSGVLE